METPTLGIEEEVLLVDARTGEPVADATAIRLAAAERADEEDFGREFRVSMIETATRACVGPGRRW